LANGIGEGYLNYYLYGSSPLTRFRLWATMPNGCRERFMSADTAYAHDNDDLGRQAVDIALGRWYRDGRIGWWE